jgi:hypothetical protein
MPEPRRCRSCDAPPAGQRPAAVRRATAKTLRLAVVVSTCVALAFALSGCGSKNESETTTTGAEAAWADGLCSAFASWRSSVAAIGATLQDADQLSTAKIEEASKNFSAANARLVDDVNALDKPPASGGEEAKTAIDDLSKDLETSSDKVKEATSDVSTLQDVVQAVNVASGALLAMSSDIGATLTTLESLGASDEWQKAFADSESCQSLGKS